MPSVHTADRAYLSGVSDPSDSRTPLADGPVAAALAGRGVAWPVPSLRASTGSTNDDVLALAAAGAPEGTCVVAEEQVAGRGRHGRVWESPVGAGLWCSVLVRAGDQPAERWALLSLAAGLAVVEALDVACGVRAELKWPNDVVVIAAACGGGGGAGDGSLRKIGGILAQAGPDGTVVLGMGTNVSLLSAELPVPTASSVLLEGGRTDRTALLAALLAALERRLAQWRTDEAALLADYRAQCTTIGRLIEVDLPGGERLRGHVTGIDDGGRLLVSDGAKTTTVAAGDVVHATI